MDSIRIRGARTHNLKNVSLELPRNRLVVITGLSGSGKSSLAFDTLYAEGQRRYVESLSAYARQFLQLMEKPDVDLIEGLSPAIAIEQKAASHNPRSTVGTVTEIHDYLRLLYARAGTPYCPEHGLALQAQTVAQMVDHVLALPEDTRLMMLAPVVAGRKGEQADLLEELRAQGFTRVRIDGKVHDLDAAPRLAKNAQALGRRGDRPAARARRRASSAWPSRSRPRCATPTARPWWSRSIDARSTCSRRSSPARHATTRCPSSSRACSRSTTRWAPARAATAWARSSSSTRSASSRTPTCRWRAARSAAGTGATTSTTRCCSRSRAHYGFDIEQPVGDAARRACRTWSCYGSGKEKIAFHYLSERGRSTVKEHAFEGVMPEPRAPLPRDRLGGGARGARQASQPRTCPDCGGTRLRREARHVKVARQDASTRSRRCRCSSTLRVLHGTAAAGREGPGRRAHRARDRQPPGVPGQRRPRLPVARPLGRDALRRRGAAHPPREPDRLGPHRRDVRARRAVDRPAPARQRAPDRARSSACATSATR